MLDRLWQSLQRLLPFFCRAQLDGDLDVDLSSHLELAIEQSPRRGLSPAAARRQALLRFGGPQQAKEQHREARSLPFLETLFQDLRFAFRVLRKSPSFTALSVLTLALGIGATTTIFSVVYGVLLRPLPFSEPSRIMRVWTHWKNSDGRGAVSAANARDWRAQNHVFEDLALVKNNQSFNFTVNGEPE